MKKYALLGELVIVVAVSACSPATETSGSAVSAEQDMAAIGRVRDDYMAAWKAGDAGAIVDLYTADAVLLPRNQPTVTGHDAIMQYSAGFFAQFVPDGIKLTSEETKVSGDLAMDRGTFDIMATPKTGGDQVHEMGRYIVLLQRQADGSWKLTRDMDNSLAPE
jgi:uncharacterized protein (TIGR02246 family)